MSVVKDVNLEAMPSSTFVDDDEEDKGQGWVRIRVMVRGMVRTRTVCKQHP